MKQLTCEMCGGIDLLKQENVFICQSCGVKYSVEEAKKLMVEIEGIVDVSGSTVKVDNSAKLDNLYKLARRARNEGNTQQAVKRYEELLVEDPDNWESNFYVAYYDGINCLKNDNPGGSVRISGGRVSLSQNYRSGISPCIVRIHNCLSNVYSLIGKNQDEREQKAASEEVYRKVKYIAGQLSDIIDNEHARMKKEIKRYFNEIDTSGVLGTVFGALDKSDTNRDNDKQRDSYKQDIADMVSLAESGTIMVEEVINKRRAEEAKRRFKEYWGTHQAEKAELEAEKKSLTVQVAALFKELSDIPSKIDGYAHMVELQQKVQKLAAEGNNLNEHPEIAALQNKANKLASEKEALGIFKGKEKKAIDEQIVKNFDEMCLIRKRIEYEISEQIKIVKNEIAPIKSRIDAAMLEVQKRIGAHQQRVTEIDKELTKPR